jgi:hypothetical protein
MTIGDEVGAADAIGDNVAALAAGNMVTMPANAAPRTHLLLFERLVAMSRWA